MHPNVTTLIAHLVGLLPTAEERLLKKVCARVQDGRTNGLAVRPAEVQAARSLADKLPCLVDYHSRQGMLRLVHRDMAELLVGERSREPGAEDPVSEIRSAQARGDFDHAMAIFESEGGVYFIHYHGVEACLDVINGFPADFHAAHEALTLSLAMHALKVGNIARARFLMVERYGDDMLRLETVIRRRERYTLAVRKFRFLMAIYEDEPVSNELRALLFDMLAECPIDDHLNRGGFYNSMLSVCLQRQELAGAEEVANRAHYHYTQANAHQLVFYIELHRVVLALRKGLLTEAEQSVAGARASLERVSFDTPADRRLIKLLEAVIGYERGESQALARFVTEEFDRFAYGEIWPAVVELALVYGSRVLSSQIGLGAAIAFLDRWRVQEWRSRRFNLAITMREVDILQSANRWQAAADRLMTVQSRINLTWVESAEEALLRLVDPIEIALAMAWLRHLIQHVPRRPLLRVQIGALLRNEAIGERERMRLRLWAAYLARMDRDMTRARALSAELLEDAARSGMITHMLGDLELLQVLADDRRIQAHALWAAGARAVMRRLQGLALGSNAHKTPLTRQELRVLALVAEGGTNKFVARQLRLAEVTVKFHLTRIYRKMGCKKRGEAIAAARSLGWI